MSRLMTNSALRSFASTLRPYIHSSTLRTILQNQSLRSSPFLRPYSSSSSSSTAQAQRYTTNKSTRSTLLRPTTILLIFVPILTGFLGVWQIKRLRWKLDLIDEIEGNLAKKPMLLPDHINLDALPEFSFRRVLVKGRLSSPPILYGPQTRDGVPGYALIQPLIRSGGSTILLNRGFITTTRATAIRNNQANVVPGLDINGGSSEEVVVEGMLTKPGEKTTWSLENNIKTNEWFWKDVDAMAEHCGGVSANVQPVLVDAVEDAEHATTLLMQQGVPVGRPAQVEIRNQHATYAATWLSLSAATSVMLVYMLRKGKAGRQPTRPRF